MKQNTVPIAMDTENPILVMIQGETPGERWELDTTRVTALGRSSRNSINLLSPTVSRFHCEIACSNGLWYLTDLNSRKGTYLNGREVDERELLKPGDVIRISGNLFRFTDARELEDFGADPDEMADGGIDLNKGPARQALRKEAVCAMAQTIRAALKKARARAGCLVLPALTFLLCFALSAALLAHEHRRVRMRDQQLRQQRREAGNELDAALQRKVRSEKTGELRHAEILDELARIAREHAAFPEAQKAAEAFAAVEADCFEKGMRAVHSRLLKQQYRAAEDQLLEMADVIVSAGLRDMIRTERAHISQKTEPAPEQPEQPEQTPDEHKEPAQDTDDEESFQTPDEDVLLERLEQPPLF